MKTDIFYGKSKYFRPEELKLCQVFDIKIKIILY